MGDKLKVGGSLAIRNSDDTGFGNLEVGNLTVYGTTTTIESVTLAVFDNIITLSANISGSTIPANNAGLEVNRGSSLKAQLIWDESLTQWTAGVEGNLGILLDTISQQTLYNKTLYSPNSYFGTIDVSGSANINSLTAVDMIDGFIIGLNGNNIGSTTSIKNAILSLDKITNFTNAPHGFVNMTDSIISFDGSTRVFTISPASTSYSIYYQGKEIEISTIKTITLDNTTGLQTIYFDSDGNLQKGTVFNLFTQITVANVLYNTTLVDGILSEERHGISMDVSTHYLLHNSDGARYISGFPLSGYVLQSSLDSDTTFQVGSGYIADEDITHSISQLDDGGPYAIFSRDGISGNWTWSTINTFPFLYDSNIQYNEFTGAIWKQTELTTNNTYVNYYVFATNAVNSDFSIIIIQGQVTNSSLGDAQLESFIELSFGNLPFAEMVPLWQITYRYNVAYGAATGSCRIEAIQRLLGSRITVSGNSSIGVHNSLSGRNIFDSHNAESISVDNSTWSYALSGTIIDLQTALNQIDTHHHSILQNGDGINTFGYNGHMPSNTVISIAFGGNGSATTASRSDHTHNPLTFAAIMIPSDPAPDSWIIYTKASGTTPNREVAFCSRNQVGDEFIISSVLI